jgi:GDP-4-dehydro-6-deoxy-D-mannose reductase
VLLKNSKSADNAIVTGNLSIVRDFVDVRDVVRAYYLLLRNGRKGEIYNICSGKGSVLKDIILKMSELLGLQIKIEVDPKLIRPNENKKVIGSYKKINDELGWKPEIPIEKSLSDIIEYWQKKIGSMS